MKSTIKDWFAALGWKPFKFQKEVWQAIEQGESGLLHATTGAGKTYAVWLGALIAFAATKVSKKPVAEPLTILWITPMRALAADTLRAIQLPLTFLAQTDPSAALWTAGARSGDTSASERAAQNKRLPTVLVTTPESLSLLLSRADAREVLGCVKMVVVDEWHELLGNKRGVQVQLALARLRSFNGALVTWGMSATLGNLDEAMHTLLGPRKGNSNSTGTLVQGQVPKKLVVDSLLPKQVERFPWGGHLGLTMLPQVVHEIEISGTTLVFTNTRSQSEIWYQALIDARPDWAGLIALHHGSLDRSVREWVEAGLKSGQLKAVVCTSSLDLGVDFLPVERVLQIGSPKGVARLLQRAGRSGHAPGRPSRITLVPTHSLEIIEGAAARAAVLAGQIETRATPDQPLDVLVQHLVTVALGGGFNADDLLLEIRSTAAYATLSLENWQWALNFVKQGGSSLAAYPDYQRAIPDENNIWRVPDARLARRHRMNIGTIVSDSSLIVQFLGGARIGTVEESFVARLKPGNCFLFGGRLLELVRLHDMTAWVKRATGKRPAVPRWNGGRMPLSSTLANAMLAQLALAASGTNDSPELKSLQPLLSLQQQWSALPTPQILLAETLKTREGSHLFLYPFAGHHVHLGLANLIAWRVAQRAPLTFSIAVNDYGFELLSATDVDWNTLLPEVLATPSVIDADPSISDTSITDPRAALLAEILGSLNASELAQRRFREIARVSGLIFQSFPGEKRGSKQLQASSSLFFEVFRKYDPNNRLLMQAEQELLAQDLDVSRLQSSLMQIASQQLVIKNLERPTPFCFPLMVERYREKLSNESVADRIARMVAELEKAADGQAKRRESKAADVQTTEHVKESLVFGGDGVSTPKGGRGANPRAGVRTRARRERTPAKRPSWLVSKL